MPLLHDPERGQWKPVGADHQARQDQWEGKRSTHQAFPWCPYGERHRMVASREREFSEKQLPAQIAAVSKALAELESSVDRELMQPLESTTDRLEIQIAWGKADRTTSRCGAWSHFEVPEAPLGSGSCQSGSRPHHRQGDDEHRELPSHNLRNSIHFLRHLRGFAKQMDRAVEFWSGLQTPCLRSQSTRRKETVSTKKQRHNPCLGCWFQRHPRFHQTHHEA